MLEIMKPCFDVMNRGFSACVNQFDIPFPFSWKANMQEGRFEFQKNYKVD